VAEPVPTGLTYWDDRDDPLAWDTLLLDGEVWPGIAEISGAGVSRKIDVKKAKGQDGATIKDEGYQLAKLTITITIYSEYQWGELQRLLPTVHPRRKGGSRTPMAITNPQANLLGVTQIYIDKISYPTKPKAKDGLCSIVMSAIEWAPAPKPVKKAAGGTGANQVYPNDPGANAQAWLEEFERIAGEHLGTGERVESPVELADSEMADSAIAAAENLLENTFPE
jgi:hypothetical protein